MDHSTPGLPVHLTISWSLLRLMSIESVMVKADMSANRIRADFQLILNLFVKLNFLLISPPKTNPAPRGLCPHPSQMPHSLWAMVSWIPMWTYTRHSQTSYVFIHHSVSIFQARSLDIGLQGWAATDHTCSKCTWSRLSEDKNILQSLHAIAKISSSECRLSVDQALILWKGIIITILSVIREIR